MTDLTLARTATETVMGMQVYERALDDRADEALARVAPTARIRRTVVRSMRSPLPGNRRVPLARLGRAGPGTRREVGRWLYPGGGPVHRLDLTLPPSPRADIVTVHDLAPLRFSDEGELPPTARFEVQRAAAVITVSRFSAAEIAEHLGGPEPVVIPNGVDHDRFAGASPLDGRDLQHLGIRSPYVLVAGGASQRKNLVELARAWPLVRSVRPDLTLVLTGPPHPRRDQLFGHLEGAVLVGRVSDEALPRLLAGAAALAVPSTYEGFGLPAIESMAAGVPVVAVDASSLPEVLGGTGVLTDGTASGLAGGIEWATNDDPDIRAKVEAARKRSLDFTWERSAALHAQVWGDVIAGRLPR